MVALITGITGQDGAYLSELLLQKGYKVIGVVRKNQPIKLENLQYLNIDKQIEFVEINLQSVDEVKQVLLKYKPTEVYNLAAQSSVSYSFNNPIETLQVNINIVLHLLEAIRTISPNTKYYQASSSEMFGKAHQMPIVENNYLNPLSPYAISKVASHHLTINYRESYNLFACSGILFNHESYLRGNNFFIKKLLKGAIDITQNKLENLSFGNLEIKRDFGYAKDYVLAMWLMMQQQIPDDFIICSGKSIKLYDIVVYVFNKLNINLSKIVIDKNLFRPAEIEDIYGNNEKAKTVLGWNGNANFYNTIDLILQEELNNYNG